MEIEKIRVSLFEQITSQNLNSSVLDLLLPEGVPHDFEDSLWDYKRKLPTLPENPTKDDRDQNKFEIHELIKDIVSFHNAFGGLNSP